MQKSNIIGADLSKKTIDLHCQSANVHLTISNDLSGFKHMVGWIRQQGFQLNDVFVVMEHTGLYSSRLEDFLHANTIAFTKVNALEIKRSIGVVRGKSDKIDAKKIAMYGSEKFSKLTAYSPLEQELKRLKLLMSSKNLLVRQRAALRCSIKEYRNIGISDKDLIIKAQLTIIAGLDKSIQKLEDDMQSIILGSVSLNNNYQLLLSIPGVGPVVALTTIIKTHNFSRFDDARKFACFAGTAPFPNESGSSIRKKTRISHLADKQMKTLLDLAAKSAVQCDPEMKAYYQKRVESGKSKRSSINVVRNKIIGRMFAIIKRQTPFLHDYLAAA